MKDKLQRLAECLPKELDRKIDDDGALLLQDPDALSLWIVLEPGRSDVFNGSALMFLLDAMEKADRCGFVYPTERGYEWYESPHHYGFYTADAEGKTRTEAIVDAALAVFGGDGAKGGGA